MLCADGLLAADLKAEFSRTLPRAGRIDVETAEAILAELGEQAEDWLAAESVAETDRRQVRVALLRYHGQGGELAVPWSDRAEDVQAGFAAAHDALYGFSLDAPIELVTLRVEATGRTPPAPRQTLPPEAGIVPRGELTVHLETGPAGVPLLDRALFGAGDQFAGPAVVAQLDATTLVPPGWQGEVHPSGALLLTRTDEPREARA